MLLKIVLFALEAQTELHRIKYKRIFDCVFSYLSYNKQHKMTFPKNQVECVMRGNLSYICSIICYHCFVEGSYAFSNVNQIVCSIEFNLPLNSIFSKITQFSHISLQFQMKGYWSLVIIWIGYDHRISQKPDTSTDVRQM